MRITYARKQYQVDESDVMRARMSARSLVTESAVMEERREAGSPSNLTRHILSAVIRTYTPQSYAARENREKEGGGKREKGVSKCNTKGSLLTILLFWTVNHLKSWWCCS